MKSLRNHFSVIFPLIFLLFSFQFAKTIGYIVDQYEKKIVDEYNIVMVAVDSIDEAEIQKKIPEISTITQIDPSVVLDKLKNDISKQNISLLELSLPKFYSIKLISFPTSLRLEGIKKSLLEDKNITKIEAYAQTFDKIYRLLTITKAISFVFLAFVLVISLLLMLKQMRIWVLEHRERMEIMSFFGAPFWMKSAVLYRLVVVDSIIATCVVSAIFYFAPYYSDLKQLMSELDMQVPQMNLVQDGGILLEISLFFALISVIIVIINLKSEKS